MSLSIITKNINEITKNFDFKIFSKENLTKILPVYYY